MGKEVLKDIFLKIAYFKSYKLMEYANFFENLGCVCPPECPTYMRGYFLKVTMRLLQHS